MLNKRKSANQLLDRMHRGVVWTCIGLTFYGSYLLGLRFYNYFAVTKPSRKEAELKMIEGDTMSKDTAQEIRA